MIKEADYEADDIIKVNVMYFWVNSPVHDYTLWLYSDQALEVLDKAAKTHMLHMDGRKPSAFVPS